MKTALLITTVLCLAALAYPQIDLQKIDIGTTDGIHDIGITPSGSIFIYTYGTGKVLRSLDNGMHWKIVAKLDSIYFEQIQFLDDKMGWICGEYGKVYFTDNAGDKWQDRSIETEHGNLLLYGMLFEDKLNGMVSGALLMDRKLDNKIYITNDGGKSWTEMQNPPKAMILNLEQSPDGNTWGSGDNIIVKYHDGTWDISFLDTTRTTGQIRDLEFIGAKTLIGASFNGKVLISNDNGQTWDITALTNNRLRSIASLRDGQVLLAGDKNREEGHLFLSKDSGASWTILDKELEDIHRIAASGAHGWLVGKNGIIIKLKL
jgi:photosystem II stability/assembly factor-like uncharacterized protein